MGWTEPTRIVFASGEYIEFTTSRITIPDESGIGKLISGTCMAPALYLSDSTMSLLSVVQDDPTAEPTLEVCQLPFPPPPEGSEWYSGDCCTQLDGILYYVCRTCNTEDKQNPLAMAVCDLSAETREWVSCEMPRSMPPTQRPILFSLSGSVYITGFQTVAETWRLNTETREWGLFMKQGHMSFARRHIVAGDTLHCLKSHGGLRDQHCQHTVFDESGGWREEPPIPESLAWCAVFGAGRSLVMLGKMSSLQPKLAGGKSALAWNPVEGEPVQVYPVKMPPGMWWTTAQLSHDTVLVTGIAPPQWDDMAVMPDDHNTLGMVVRITCGTTDQDATERVPTAQITDFAPEAVAARSTSLIESVLEIIRRAERGEEL
ncbi:hypothetical protein KIPB_006361 [Kipferlia bialata]|uniref:Uncharacterized protein n=1 Tax=Kipferlia bialata TaxID=797122 RepID=A0A9K3D040_9EUKA|nr:hypothetical protein KIPB_006361 [Kipferlia bialata]|eukprot:g6361.t1